MRITLQEVANNIAAYYLGRRLCDVPCADGVYDPDVPQEPVPWNPPVQVLGRNEYPSLQHDIVGWGDMSVLVAGKGFIHI